MPEDLPDRMPDRLSEDMPEDMPDRVPEDMPEHMPGRMPEDMPDSMPEDMPGRMPEDMPDRMPDRMPEDMPDRMSEDLPVTKRINVMVGITRSKVIKLNDNTPKNLLCTIGCHPNNCIIEDLGHSWGTLLKNCLGAVFSKGLTRHLTIWETLHFQGFSMDTVF